MEELLQKWKNRLQRFRDNPAVAKGMDNRTAMGVQNGRVITMECCIEELEKLRSDEQERTVGITEWR